ncbi:hypothetical protein ABLO27_01410 [Roseibium sp. SCPC15]|uniref:hypothetical protein n=1 Tax=Roseibium sp. SCP15 TaxID=3141376 RepID=UPI00333BD4EB
MSRPELFTSQDFDLTDFYAEYRPFKTHVSALNGNNLRFRSSENSPVREDVACADLHSFWPQKAIRTASSMNRDFGAPRAVRVSFVGGTALPIEGAASLLPPKNCRSESVSFSTANSCPLDESQFGESQSRYKLELLTPVKVVNAEMPTIQALSP